MDNRTTLILALSAGLFLIVAGILFILIMPPMDSSAVNQAKYLFQYKIENYSYVLAVFLSNIFIVPVIVLLTIRLYNKKISYAILPGSVFLFAVIIETLAVLISLARWSYAIPSAARGVPEAINTFNTLQMLYLSVDVPGALLFYVAAVIYAVIIRNLNKICSSLLILSLLVFIAGTIISTISNSISMIFSGLSIIIYGLAYVLFGQVTIKLNGEESYGK